MPNHCPIEIPFVDSRIELPHGFIKTQNAVVDVLVDEKLTEWNSIDFAAGNKKLSLWVPSIKIPNFFTLVETNPVGERQEGATTALYTRADECMQELVDIYGKPIEYTFDTQNDPMIAWGNTKGVPIFGWDQLQEANTEGYRTGAKVYTPQS